VVVVLQHQTWVSRSIFHNGACEGACLFYILYIDTMLMVNICGSKSRKRHYQDQVSLH
jgi:hypothetical protein